MSEGYIFVANNFFVNQKIKSERPQYFQKCCLSLLLPHVPLRSTLRTIMLTSAREMLTPSRLSTPHSSWLVTWPSPSTSNATNAARTTEIPARISKHKQWSNNRFISVPQAQTHPMTEFIYSAIGGSLQFVKPGLRICKLAHVIFINTWLANMQISTCNIHKQQTYRQCSMIYITIVRSQDLIYR